jgi:hypothetical protein
MLLRRALSLLILVVAASCADQSHDNTSGSAGQSNMGAGDGGRTLGQLSCGGNLYRCESSTHTETVDRGCFGSELIEITPAQCQAVCRAITPSGSVGATSCRIESQDQTSVEVACPAVCTQEIPSHI